MIRTDQRDKILEEDFSLMLKRVIDAVKGLKLIEDGDSVLAAVSGGKDSLSMLHILDYIQKKEMINFKLLACNVDLGISCTNEDLLKRHFEDFGIEYSFVQDQITDKESDEDIGCFWCSWNRRKALFRTAKKNKCNKVSLGHHIDDIIHTAMLNIFIHGELSTAPPKLDFFDGLITVIRPLCYIKEYDTENLASCLSIPVSTCECPQQSVSKREFMKKASAPILDNFPETRDNFYNALVDARERI